MSVWVWITLVLTLVPFVMFGLCWGLCVHSARISRQEERAWRRQRRMDAMDREGGDRE